MASRLIPGQPHPALRFETLGHGAYDLGQGAPVGGTYLAFHRGSHCKWTRLMLKELDDRIGDFALRGIRIVAIGFGCTLPMLALGVFLLARARGTPQ